MAAAGCDTLMYGIENANPEILVTLKKYTSPDKVEDIIRHTKNCGIKTLGFFMIGSPGETYDTAIQTIELSRALELDYVQFTKLTPFPNTEIYRMLVDDGFGDYWREFTLDPTIEKELPLVKTKLTSKEAMWLVKKAYLSFYFRPSYILRSLKKTKSYLELKNSYHAAMGLIFDR
jgi:radical SAM superfamily enzyme YgiQ (UPF0313 family)